MRQGGALGAAAVRNLIAALRGRFPARFKAIHFLSPPLYVQATLALVKPFLDEKTRHKVRLFKNSHKVKQQVIYTINFHDKNYYKRDEKDSSCPCKHMTGINAKLYNSCNYNSDTILLNHDDLQHQDFRVLFLHNKQTIFDKR